MATCSFCGNEISAGTGKMFVKKDARLLYFCSRRCEKSLLKLKRTPRKTKFTVAAAQAKKQHMAELAHVASQGKKVDE
jgi:large subunit ribosomal protein L24e